MKTSSKHFAKPDNHEGKSKSPYEASVHAQDRNWGQPAKKRSAPDPLAEPAPSLQADRAIHSTQALYHIEVFNTIKDQLWVRRLRRIQYDPSHPEIEEYCSYHYSKGHKNIH